MTGDSRETLRISGIAVTLAREHGLDRDEEVRSRFFENLDAKMDETGPGDELVSLLNQLKKGGYVLGLVTFVRHARLSRRLTTWNLREYFRTTVTPDQVAEFKPSPQPYLRAIADLSISPGECLVIGDEPVDMLGGKRAGARTIGIPQGFYSREELEKAGADSIIPSLNVLPSILPRVNI